MKKKITRNRGVQKGIDHKKLARIFLVLKEADNWLHIAEISRRAQVNQVTTRYYLDNYMKNVIENQKIHDKIRIRLIKLKPDVSFTGLIRALETLREIKDSSKNQS